MPLLLGCFSLDKNKSKIENPMGRYQSGQMEQTVNLLASAFVGSNPARPTFKIKN